MSEYCWLFDLSDPIFCDKTIYYKVDYYYELVGQECGHTISFDNWPTNTNELSLDHNEEHKRIVSKLFYLLFTSLKWGLFTNLSSK